MSSNSMKQARFYCFSPLVMIATFAIEVLGAVWMIVRYKQTSAARLIVGLLLLLAIFQLAEYMVCEGAFGISSMDWARIGYVAISLLPALGMHLAMTIAHSVNRYVVGLGYVVALLFAAFFLLGGEHGVTNDVCMGNYVIFEMSRNVVYLYALYYYGWLLAGMAYSFVAGRRLYGKQKKALIGLSIGYFSFIFPTTLVNVLEPATLAAIPSIMCGFAVMLAIILVVWVAPAVCIPRRFGNR